MDNPRRHGGQRADVSVVLLKMDENLSQGIVDGGWQDRWEVFASEVKPLGFDDWHVEEEQRKYLRMTWEFLGLEVWMWMLWTRGWTQRTWSRLGKARVTDGGKCILFWACCFNFCKNKPLGMWGVETNVGLGEKWGLEMEIQETSGYWWYLKP